MNSENAIVRDGEDYKIQGTDPAWLRVGDFSFIIRTLDVKGESILVVAYPYGREDEDSIGSMYVTVCEDSIKAFPHTCVDGLQETVIERDGEDYILTSDTGWLRVGNVSLRFSTDNNLFSVQAFPYGREDEEALEIMILNKTVVDVPSFS